MLAIGTEASARRLNRLRWRGRRPAARAPAASGGGDLASRHRRDQPPRVKANLESPMTLSLAVSRSMSTKPGRVGSPGTVEIGIVEGRAPAQYDVKREESRADRRPDFAHVHGMTGRRALLGRIGR